MSNTSSPAPLMALRTYMAIRLGVVAVIVGLAFAVRREIAHSPNHCVQRSLSAYYFKSVRPVFVGAMLLIGFAMVVLWGKTHVEDNGLNLAGLLLMVVACVPTLDADYCSLPTPVRNAVVKADTRQEVENALIRDNAATVHSSFGSLLFVLWLVLVTVAIIGVVYFLRTPAGVRPSVPVMLAYGLTWVLALVAASIYSWLFRSAREPQSAFNHQVHRWSANIAVGLVILAVVSAAAEKRRDAAKAWATA